MAVDQRVEQFSSLEDPRCAGKIEHRLIDILVIAVCAAIGCARGDARKSPKDQAVHVGVIPSRFLAPAADAGAGRPISGDEIEGDLAQHSQIARGGAVAHPAVVLAEGD